MPKTWIEEHDEAWEREVKQIAKEKWQEKYWSEIEDGLCPPEPPTFKAAFVPHGVDPKLKKALEELEVFLKEKRERQ